QLCALFCSQPRRPLGALRSFPTRRSSDLSVLAVGGASASATSPALPPPVSPAPAATAVMSPPEFWSVEPTTTRCDAASKVTVVRSEEHTSELQSPDHLVCRLLLEKKKTKK